MFSQEQASTIQIQIQIQLKNYLKNLVLQKYVNPILGTPR